jgi:hypothetical protein
MVCVGLVGFADFADGYYTTIDHRAVQDSNPRPCTHWVLTTIDSQNQRFEPTTMHYYTTIDQKKWNIRTHDHALHHHWPQNSKIRTHNHALHHNLFFFLLGLRVRAASNSAYSGYPELWILRYPAHRYHAVPSPGFEPTTLWLRVRLPNHSATTLHDYTTIDCYPPKVNWLSTIG